MNLSDAIGPHRAMHLPAAVLTRYATGDLDLDETTVWTVEAHLECCRDCRTALTEMVDPGVRSLLDEVAGHLDLQIPRGPAPVRPAKVRRLLHRWAVWLAVPWAAMIVVALLVALLLDTAYPHRPSLVLLLAPIAPLAGMGATWSRRADPAWEIIAGTPRAGLELLLRRAAIILAGVIPSMAVVGWYAGQSPARWLLPCLTFTVATLQLGSRIGIGRAATVLGLGWLVAVVAPSMLTGQVSVLMRSASVPCWVAVSVAAVGMLLVQRGRATRRA